MIGRGPREGRRRAIRIDLQAKAGGEGGGEGGQAVDPDEPGFLAKARSALAGAGREGLEKAFLAAHVVRDPDTPIKAKSLLIGSLAYFVMPFDKVPDWIVVLGYTDDIAMLTTALLAVAASVKPEHREMAKASVAKVMREAPAPE